MASKFGGAAAKTAAKTTPQIKRNIRGTSTRGSAKTTSAQTLAGKLNKAGARPGGVPRKSSVGLGKSLRSSGAPKRAPRKAGGVPTPKTQANKQFWDKVSETTSKAPGVTHTVTPTRVYEGASVDGATGEEFQLQPWVEEHKQQLDDFGEQLGDQQMQYQQILADLQPSGQVLDIGRIEVQEALKDATASGIDIEPVMKEYLLSPEAFLDKQKETEELKDIADKAIKDNNLTQEQVDETLEAYREGRMTRAEAENYFNTAKSQYQPPERPSAFAAAENDSYSQDFLTDYDPHAIEDPALRKITMVDQVGNMDFSQLWTMAAGMDPATMSGAELLQNSLLLQMAGIEEMGQKEEAFLREQMYVTLQQFNDEKDSLITSRSEMDKALEGKAFIPTTFEGLQAKIYAQSQNMQLDSIEAEKAYMTDKHDIWQAEEARKRSRLEGYLKGKLYAMGAQDSSAGLSLMGEVIHQADLRLQLENIEYRHGVAKLNSGAREIMTNYTNSVLDLNMKTQTREAQMQSDLNTSLQGIRDQKFLNDRERDKLVMQTMSDYTKELNTLRKEQDDKAFEMMKFDFEKVQALKTEAYQLSGIMGSYFYADPGTGQVVDTGVPTFEAKSWQGSYMLDMMQFEHKQQFDAYNYSLDLAAHDLSEREFKQSALYDKLNYQLDAEKADREGANSMFEIDYKIAELDNSIKKDTFDIATSLADYGIEGSVIADITGIPSLSGLKGKEEIKRELDNQTSLFELEGEALGRRQKETSILKDKLDMGITLIDQGATGEQIEVQLDLPTGFFKGVTSKEAMKNKFSTEMNMFATPEGEIKLEKHRADLIEQQFNMKKKAVELAMDVAGKGVPTDTIEQILDMTPGSLEGLSQADIRTNIEKKFEVDQYSYGLKENLFDWAATAYAGGAETNVNPINTAYPDGYYKEGLECGTFLHNIFDIPAMGDSLSSKIRTMDNVLNGTSMRVISQAVGGVAGAIQTGMDKGLERMLPQVGDMLVLDVGTEYGHVAVVNSINPDGTATLTESNYANKWTVSNTRTISRTDSKISGIHRGDLKAGYKDRLARYDGIYSEALLDWQEFGMYIDNIAQGMPVGESERGDLRDWARTQPYQIQQAVYDAIREGDEARGAAGKSILQSIIGGSTPVGGWDEI